MIIGYSEETLWAQIGKQGKSIDDEMNWLKLYISTGEVECVEDCARNILESCQAILENTDYLKGEVL